MPPPSPVLALCFQELGNIVAAKEKRAVIRKAINKVRAPGGNMGPRGHCTRGHRALRSLPLSRSPGLCPPPSQAARQQREALSFVLLWRWQFRAAIRLPMRLPQSHLQPRDSAGSVPRPACTPSHPPTPAPSCRLLSPSDAANPMPLSPLEPRSRTLVWRGGAAGENPMLQCCLGGVCVFSWGNPLLLWWS